MGSVVVKNGAAKSPDLGRGPAFKKKLIVNPVAPVFAYNSESAIAEPIFQVIEIQP